MEKLQFIFRTEISPGRYIDLGGETGELEYNLVKLALYALFTKTSIMTVLIKVPQTFSYLISLYQHSLFH